MADGFFLSPVTILCRGGGFLEGHVDKSVVFWIYKLFLIMILEEEEERHRTMVVEWLATKQTQKWVGTRRGALQHPKSHNNLLTTLPKNLFCGSMACQLNQRAIKGLLNSAVSTTTKQICFTWPPNPKSSPPLRSAAWPHQDGDIIDSEDG